MGLAAMNAAPCGENVRLPSDRWTGQFFSKSMDAAVSRGVGEFGLSPEASRRRMEMNDGTGEDSANESTTDDERWGLCGFVSL